MQTWIENANIQEEKGKKIKEMKKRNGSNASVKSRKMDKAIIVGSYVNIIFRRKSQLKSA